MTSSSPSDNTFSSYDNISEEQASLMLKLGLPGPRNAADDLVNFLESLEGPAWAARVIEEPPFNANRAATASLFTSKVPLESLQALKEAGKEMVKRPTTRSVYLAGLAAYYLAIASALLHHGQVITRTPRAELNQILIELASVAPAPWRELFVAAASRQN
jgi:hypothetical protein